MNEKVGIRDEKLGLVGFKPYKENELDKIAKITHDLHITYGQWQCYDQEKQNKLIAEWEREHYGKE